MRSVRTRADPAWWRLLLPNERGKRDLCDLGPGDPAAVRCASTEVEGETRGAEREHALARGLECSVDGADRDDFGAEG